MLESGFFESGEAFQAVGVYGGTRCDVLLKESQESRTLEIRNDGHASSTGCTPAFLHGNQDQSGLSTLQLSTATQARLLATNPRIINFYFTLQRFARQVNHR